MKLTPKLFNHHSQVGSCNERNFCGVVSKNHSSLRRAYLTTFLEHSIISLIVLLVLHRDGLLSVIENE